MKTRWLKIIGREKATYPCNTERLQIGSRENMKTRRITIHIMSDNEKHAG